MPHAPQTRSVQERIAEQLRPGYPWPNHWPLCDAPLCTGCRWIRAHAAAIEREIVAPRVEAERERAAKIVERMMAERSLAWSGDEIAAAIRATGGADA